MGEGQYVDQLIIRVQACTDGTWPLPENLEAAWQRSFPADGKVDINAVIEELKASIQPEPYTLDAKYGLMSWGASGALLEVVISLTSGTAFLVLDKIWDALAGHTKHREQTVDADAEQVSEAARSFVASARQVPLDEVKVRRLERTPVGYEIDLVAGRRDHFRIETDLSGTMYKAERSE